MVMVEAVVVMQTRMGHDGSRRRNHNHLLSVKLADGGWDGSRHCVLTPSKSAVR